MLEGKRTYLIAILLIVASVAQNLGYISDSDHQTILGVLLGGGLTTLRAAAGTTKTNPPA